MTDNRSWLRAMTVGMALTLLGSSPAGATFPEMEMTDDNGNAATADLDDGGHVHGDGPLDPPWWLPDEGDSDREDEEPA